MVCCVGIVSIYYHAKSSLKKGLSYGHFSEIWYGVKCLFYVSCNLVKSYRLATPVLRPSTLDPTLLPLPSEQLRYSALTADKKSSQNECSYPDS